MGSINSPFPIKKYKSGGGGVFGISEINSTILRNEFIDPTLNFGLQ